MTSPTYPVSSLSSRSALSSSVSPASIKPEKEIEKLQTNVWNVVGHAHHHNMGRAIVSSLGRASAHEQRKKQKRKCNRSMQRVTSLIKRCLFIDFVWKTPIIVMTSDVSRADKRLRMTSRSTWRQGWWRHWRCTPQARDTEWKILIRVVGSVSGHRVTRALTVSTRPELAWRQLRFSASNSAPAFLRCF